MSFQLAAEPLIWKRPSNELIGAQRGGLISPTIAPKLSSAKDLSVLDLDFDSNKGPRMVLLDLPPDSFNADTNFHGARQGLRSRHVAAFAVAMTCAGPFGLEDCVATMGAFWTLVGFPLTSVFYVMPQILMTTELSMTLPVSNGGVVSWVARAFGIRMASCTALNMLTYQIVDLATYPALVVGYATTAVPDIDGWARLYAPFAIVIIGLGINLLHVEVASELYTWMLLLIIFPFLVGVALSLPHLAAAWAFAQGETPATKEPPSMDVNLFISTMCWLNTGWDSMGNLASEVSSPACMLSGLLMACAASLLLYMVCTLSALGAGRGDWGDGYLAVAFGRYFAPLRPWISGCATASTILLYTSELTTVAHLVRSLADPEDELRLLPSFLARRTRTGAPVAALVMLTFIEVGLVLLSFQYLVQLSTLLHVVTFWLALGAYMHSKVCRPEMQRLFVVPGGLWGGWGIFVLKVPVLIFLLVSACGRPPVVLGALAANIGFGAAVLLGSRFGGAAARASQDDDARAQPVYDDAINSASCDRG